MLEEHVDAAIRIGELPDSSLIATHLGYVRKIACASPGYLAARKTPKTLKELAAHDFVTNLTLDSAHSWDFHERKAKIPTRVRSRLAVTTAEAAVDAAVAGVGITRVLSYQAESAVRAGKLKVVLEKFEPSPRPVHIVYPGGRALPLKLRSLRDFVAPKLRDQLSSSSHL